MAHGAQRERRPRCEQAEHAGRLRGGLLQEQQHEGRQRHCRAEASQREGEDSEETQVLENCEHCREVAGERHRFHLSVSPRPQRSTPVAAPRSQRWVEAEFDH